VAEVRCAMHLTKAKNHTQTRKRAAAITSSIIIGRNPDEVYRFWCDFSRLPEIFDRLDSVQVIDGRRSHLVLTLPLGGRLEWDAEITDDQPNSPIALAFSIDRNRAFRRGAVRTGNRTPWH
jgi:uncharacterized membrane protein